jgi:hypothetical protein
LLNDHHFMTTGGAASNGYLNAWRTYQDACADAQILRNPHIASSDTFRLVAAWVLVHRRWQSLDTLQSALNHYFDIELDQSTKPFTTRRILSIKKAYRRRRFEKDKAAGAPQMRQRVYLAPRGVKLLVQEGQRLGALNKQGRLSAAGCSRLSDIGIQLIGLLGLWRASSLSHKEGDIQLRLFSQAGQLTARPASGDAGLAPVVPVAPAVATRVASASPAPTPAPRRSARAPLAPLRFTADHRAPIKWHEVSRDALTTPPLAAVVSTQAVVPASSLFRVVITGGPCSGKSTALQLIKPRIEAAGFHCVYTMEGATRILDGCGGYDSTWAGKPEHVAMQCTFLDAQIYEEDLMMRMAALRPGPTVMISDRGALDGIAFCSDEQWAAVLKHGRTSVSALLQRYDLVVDMQTIAALGDGSGYEWGPTCVSNKARFHNPAQAREAAAQITAAYATHPHYREVSASNDFEVKVDSLFHTIMAAAPMPCAGDAPVITPAPGLAGGGAPAPADMAHDGISAELAARGGGRDGSGGSHDSGGAGRGGGVAIAGLANQHDSGSGPQGENSEFSAEPLARASGDPTNLIQGSSEFGSFSDLEYTTRFIKGWEAHDRRLPYTKTIPAGPGGKPDHARNVVFSIIHTALEVGKMEACLRTGQGMEALDLSKIMMNTIAKTELDALGARGMKVTSHSWRKTGASAMRARGVAFHIIQEEGLWSDVKYAKLYADPRYPKDAFMSELFDWLPRERLV